MAKMIQLTEFSWIITKNGEKFGLLRKKQEMFSLLGGPYHGNYNELSDLETKLGESLKEEKMIIKKEEYGDINGFPIKHDEVFDVKKEKNYTSYLKKVGSLDRYAAGYFAVQHQGKYTFSLSPRVTSLKDGFYKGPFKTKIECEHIIKVENNK